MSTPLTQPKAYNVILAENIGVGDNIGDAATQTALKTTQPTPNPIIGYKSRITATGVRYQTPIYENEQPKPVEVPDPFSSSSTKSLSDTIGSETSIQKAQSTALGNGLIDLSNKQIVAKNQSIGLGNALADISNQQNIEKEQSSALGNGLIDLSKQQAIPKIQSNALGNALADISKQQSSQKIQLAEQSNINNAIDNALGKLSIETFVSNAAKSGVTSFDILGPSAIGGAFGSQGVKLGTTTPENALSDLASFQAKGIPVSLSYQTVTKSVPGPFDSIKTSIVSSPLGSFVKGLYGGANVYNEKSPLPTPFTGLSASVKEGSTSTVPLLSPSGTKTYQPSTIDSGIFGPSFGQKNSQYQVGSILGTIGFGALQLGLPEVKIPSVISDVLKIGTSKGIVSDLAKAASEGETTIAPQIEKTSGNTFHITLGTEGRSITPTQTFQKMLDIFRLPTTKEIPGFGTVATEEGKVGANEVKIPKITQEIGNLQGESAISDIFVQPGKSGITAIIPKDINPDLTENSFLINDLNPVMQTRLNAVPVETLPGYFSGKLTPETRLILKQAQDTGLITKEKQVIQFPTVDVEKSPILYTSIAKSPSILGETGTAATEKLFPDITRPDVLAVYRTESKGFESSKGLNVYQGEPYGSKGEDAFLNNYANLNFKPIINPETGKLEEIRGFGEEVKAERVTNTKRKSKPFSFEGIGRSSIGAGASGKANALLSETKNENLLKDFYKTSTKTEEKKIGDYLGFTPRTTGRSRQTEETEILSFPPGTKSELTGKQIGIQGISISNDILQGLKEKQSRAERSGILFRFGSELQQRQNQRERLGTISLTRQNQKTSPDQSLRFTLSHVQTTRTGQGQKNALSELTSLSQLTRTTPIQTGRTGSLQGQDLLQTPDLIPKLLLTPLLIPTTTPTRIPPKTPIGFNFPDFSSTYGGEGGPKQKKVRFRKSFVAYSVNPNIVGAIEQAGLPGLQVGKSAVIYQNVDKQLAKATKLQYKGSKLRF